MPTIAPEPLREGSRLLVPGVRAIVLGIALVLLLAGCSDPIEPTAPESAPTSGSPAALPSTIPVPPDLLKEFQRALSRRAGAVLARDESAFRNGLAKWPDNFVAEQEAYFSNLAQLPIGELSYTVGRGSLLRLEDDYWVAVEVSLQLEGYDALPVVSRDRYRFSPSRKEPGRFLLSSVSDPEWEQLNEVDVQPWDITPIQVRQEGGVLGIFDSGSISAADALMASVARGATQVAAVVPYGWDATVVLYALSDPTFLESIDDLPGDDPQKLDGVAFPVLAGPGSRKIAATRFVLSPGMLTRAGAERDRLVRHELTHVAIGERDDLAPLWLSEGLAEYVSVRPLPPESRQVDPSAIAQAEAGVDALPADETFNDDDSAVHYGIAWWACEYVAATYGDYTLWSLLDYVNVPDADPGKRMQIALGLNSRQLARAGAKLLIQTYDPAFFEPTAPPSPSETASPSANATPMGSPSASTEPPAGQRVRQPWGSDASGSPVARVAPSNTVAP